MSGLKHVYILGAGFSMPLGGPSFNQLISMREDDFVRSHCHPAEMQNPSQDLISRMNELVGDIWESLGRTPDRAGNFLDVNIEETLEILDYCEEKPNSTTARTLIKRIFLCPVPAKEGFSELNRILRVRLAMSTLLFLEIIPDNSERWSPYTRWFGGLTKDDTILTFNYDNVVERAAELAGRAYYQALKTSRPQEIMSSDLNPDLLKLHGSATWVTSRELKNACLDDIECREFDWPRMIEDTKLKVMIGTPGLTKSRYAAKFLEPIWTKAKEAIAGADLVSIIGYSMPPTDTEANGMILDHLAANKNPHLAVDIVLGPSSRSDTANRMQQIISQVMGREYVDGSGRLFSRSNRIKVRPMYSQDYLAMKQPKNVEEVWDRRCD